MNRLLTISISIILTLSMINCRNNVNKAEISGIDSLIGKKVPHFNGYLLNDSIANETFFNNKVVLINFMFIGCQGCMQELSNLAALDEKYKNKNFMIVTIMPHIVADIKSYNGNGDTTKIYYKIRKRLKYPSINNPIIAECKTREFGDEKSFRPNCGNISDKFKLSGYPCNFLIDKNGIIKKIYGNLVDDLEFNELQNQIDDLIE